MKRILTVLILIAASNAAMSQITQFNPGMPHFVNSMGGSGIIGATHYNYTVGEPYVQFGGQACDSLFAGFQHLTNLDTVSNTISIIANGPTTFCLNSNVQLSASISGSFYTWYKDNLVVGTNATFNATQSGNYKVRVVNACGDVVYSNITTITVINPPDIDICVVRTDSFAGTEQYNRIYWDKTLFPGGVDSVIVYRNTINGYQRIGAVPNDANTYSIFADTSRNIGGPNGGDPAYSNFQYKIAAKDYCNNEGNQSPYHTSIFVNPPNSGTFTWNVYDIENQGPIPGYTLMKDALNNGNWLPVISVTGTTANDPFYSLTADYRVDAVGFDCDPTRATVNTTRSNIRRGNFQLPLVVNASSNNTCVGQCSGSANVLATGGLGNYTYSWAGPSFSSTSQNITNLCVGTYTVTVSDGSSSTTASVTIAGNALPDTSVTVGVNLVANQTGATYQWFNCSTNSSITGETNQSFTPPNTTNISYSVIVTLNGCVDTSACYFPPVANKMLANDNAGFYIFPNPANESITIKNESYNAGQNTVVKIYDMLGALVHIEQMSSNMMMVNIQTYAKGVYTIAVENNEQRMYKKLIVK